MAAQEMKNSIRTARTDRGYIGTVDHTSGKRQVGGKQKSKKAGRRKDQMSRP